MSKIMKVERLIEIKQLPVIEERLKEISSQVQSQVDEALSLVVTEETVKEVKKERTAIRKTFEELEEKRKTTKELVMAPYNEFEKVYKKYITDICIPADEKLKKKIDEVEQGLKDEKEAEVKEYFAEVIADKDIDFLNYDQLGIRVLLSSSLSKLKEQVDEFVGKVANDLIVIEAMDDAAEILVEYRQTLDLSKSVTSVQSRKARLAEEQKRRERLSQKKIEEVPLLEIEPEEKTAPFEPLFAKTSEAQATVFAPATTIIITAYSDAEIKEVVDLCELRGLSYKIS